LCFTRIGRFVLLGVGAGALVLKRGFGGLIVGLAVVRLLAASLNNVLEMAEEEETGDELQ
jgi:hypothetical protein